MGRNLILCGLGEGVVWLSTAGGPCLGGGVLGVPLGARQGRRKVSVPAGVPPAPRARLTRI